MIKRLQKSELDTIQKMANEIWPVCFKEMISQSQIEYMLDWMYTRKKLEDNFDKGHAFIILKKENKKIGFASFEKKRIKARIRLHKLYVDPNQHHNGAGRELLNYIINEGKRNSLSTLDLFVNRTNPAVTFYEKIGFEIVESIDLEIGNGFFMNDYRMEIEI